MSQESLAGWQIGNYAIQRLIGRGGMAAVYYAEDVRLKRPVAVKVIDTRDGTGVAQRFLQEAQAVAAWRHENIVQVYYAGDVENLYYFAMEYIDGENLADILDRYARQGELLPVEDALRIGEGIARALDYAHQHGVIHRDVKPANVFIERGQRVVLGDFGLSLNLNRGSMGEIFGTAHYIAPEQARRSNQAQPQSDLYSLGVMLYEMLTGIVPFDDPSPTAVALQHLTMPPPPPSQVNPNLNQATEDVLLKALSKEPSGRYPSGAELMSALRRAVQAGAPQPAVRYELPPPPPGAGPASPAPTLWRAPSPRSVFVHPMPLPAANGALPDHLKPTRLAPSPRAGCLGALRFAGRAALLLLVILAGIAAGVQLYALAQARGLLPGLPLLSPLAAPWIASPAGPPATGTPGAPPASPTALAAAAGPSATAAQPAVVPTRQAVATSTATRPPTATATATATPLTPTRPPSATPMASTSTATSTPVTPAATSTATPATPAATFTPSATPSPTLSPTATVLYPDGKRFALYYNDTSLYMKQLSGNLVYVEHLSFERLTVAGQPAQFFDGFEWAKYNLTTQPTGCMRLEVVGHPLSSYLRPAECQDVYYSTRNVRRGVDWLFWTPQDGSTQFRVVWSGREVARCEIAAGACEFYLPGDG